MSGSKPPWRYSDGTEIGAVGAVSLSRGGPSVTTVRGGEKAAIIWRISYSFTLLATAASTAGLSWLVKEASSFQRGLNQRARRFCGTTEHDSSTTTTEAERP